MTRPVVIKIVGPSPERLRQIDERMERTALRLMFVRLNAECRRLGVSSAPESPRPMSWKEFGDAMRTASRAMATAANYRDALEAANCAANKSEAELRRLGGVAAAIGTDARLPLANRAGHREPTIRTAADFGALVEEQGRRTAISLEVVVQALKGPNRRHDAPHWWQRDRRRPWRRAKVYVGPPLKEAIQRLAEPSTEAKAVMHAYGLGSDLSAALGFAQIIADTHLVSGVPVETLRNMALDAAQGSLHSSAQDEARALLLRVMAGKPLEVPSA